MRGRKNLNLIMLLLFAFLFSMVTVTNSWAAPQEVKQISIKVNQDSSGNVTEIIPRKEGYTVEYKMATNSADTGDKPVAIVTVTAKDGYIFWKDFDKSSHFSITGGKFSEGWRISGSVVHVEIECSKVINGKLSTPTGLEWEENWGLASWGEVDNADYYKVKVNGTEVGGVIYNNYIDLSGYIKYRTRNKFQVKACSNSSYLKESAWSEKSEELYFNDMDDWNNRYDGYYDDYNNYNGVEWRPGGNYGGDTYYNSLRNEWRKEGGIWYYYDSNGYRTKNGMYKINGCWYLFDNEGRMKTGYQTYNGKWYYFDDENGWAVTGWRMVNGAWNYFEEGTRATQRYIRGASGKLYYVELSMLENGWHDGRYFKYIPNDSRYDGAMLTNCWEYINGYWYYFNGDGYAIANQVAQINGATYQFAADGKLLTNHWINYNGASYYIKSDGTMARNEWIDGYYLDGSGRWIR